MNKVAELDLEKTTEVESPAPKTVKKSKKSDKKETRPSKRYLALRKSVEEEAYPQDEAIKLVLKNASAKFDETIEAHLRLGIDPSQTSQQVRGSVQLPHGTGKKIRVLVFASGPLADEAAKAGATVATDGVVTQIEKGSIPFDLVLAAPDAMPQIAKLARILGVRGLMPNPRAGTVTTEITEMIQARNKGLVDFKNENSLLHLSIGKASFKEAQVKENLLAVLQAVRSAKPAKTSGEFIKQITISSTMGPGVKVNLESIT